MINVSYCISISVDHESSLIVISTLLMIFLPPCFDSCPPLFSSLNSKMCRKIVACYGKTVFRNLIVWLQLLCNVHRFVVQNSRCQILWKNQKWFVPKYVRQCAPTWAWWNESFIVMYTYTAWFMPFQTAESCFLDSCWCFCFVGMVCTCQGHLYTLFICILQKFILVLCLWLLELLLEYHISKKRWLFNIVMLSIPLNCSLIEANCERCATVSFG